MIAKGLLYDALTRSFERGAGGRVRSALLEAAAGRVLEIGAGTGANLPHYPAHLRRLVLTEPDGSMARRLRTKLPGATPFAEVVEADATALPFPDASFDTAVATLVLCTVPAPDRALAELRRVLRPGGALLFAEHVRAVDPRRARWQDRLERPWSLVAGGCHPNRPTLETIVAAGFHVVEQVAGELPGFPRLVRPYVAGRAIAAASATGASPKASATSS